MVRYKGITSLLVVLLLWSTLSSAQVVEVPDTNLREAIRQTLALPAGHPLTRQDMLKLERLDNKSTEKRGIVDLTGLEYATNLKEISLNQNRITDLSPLSNLIQLEYLAAWGNPISDLSPLAGLTELRSLDFGGCEISDIAPLANLKGLERANLRVNRIIDITPLAGLTQLKELRINDNRIIDHSPLFGLSLTLLEWDEPCELPSLPIDQRIKNRTYPSIFAAWGGVGWSPVENLPELTDREQIALHDFYWTGTYAGQGFFKTADGWRIVGPLKRAQEFRDTYLDWNPNMVFIAEVRIRDANINVYGEDFPYWLRDSGGNRIYDPALNAYFTDFTQPGMQDIIVQHAIAVAKCGLYDGIFFDWFAEAEYSVFRGRYSYEVEQQAKDTILRRIRESVRDDFLIIINTARYKIPRRAWGINGTFMEAIPDNLETGYTRDEIKQIEDTLRWAEVNLRYPQVNCLEGWGIPHEPPDSPRNLRWMRFFTTMSLTHSDGYVLYGMNNTHQHIWHNFWNADLGYPVGAKSQAYQDIDGLFIREFTNGWAVYNRSGETQAISLPQVSVGFSSSKKDITHLLPDLDGEIYLRAGVPIDVNADGTINVLDLIRVASSFGTKTGDINGDGETNILDLTLVAQQFK